MRERSEIRAQTNPQNVPVPHLFHAVTPSFTQLARSSRRFDLCFSKSNPQSLATPADSCTPCKLYSQKLLLMHAYGTLNRIIPVYRLSHNLCCKVKRRSKQLSRGVPRFCQEFCQQHVREHGMSPKPPPKARIGVQLN